MKTNMLHSITAIIWTLFLCTFSGISLYAQNNWGEVSKEFQGSGTQSDPYLITSAADMRLLSDEVEKGTVYRDRYFLMTQDITFNKNVLNADGELNVLNARYHEEWKPIGKGRFPFCGIFDGNGHTIYGLYHGDVLKDSVALFGYFDGVVKNLIIKDSYLSGKNVGGFVCCNPYSRTVTPRIENCHSFIRILASNIAGGVFVCSNNSLDYVNKCSNHGTVEGLRCAGISYSIHTRLYNCVNYGTVIGKYVAVGVAGGTRGMAIYNCVNKGQIKADKQACAITGPTYQYGQSIKIAVNTGYCYGEESYICHGGKGANPFKVYYLEFTAEDDCGVYNIPHSEFVKVRTEDELKSPSFIQELNSYRATVDYSNDEKVNLCYWIEDQDGYPTLDFISDLALGIDGTADNCEKMAVSYNDGTTLTVKNVSPSKPVSAVSITGQILATQMADKNGTARFTNLPNQHNMIILKSEKTALKVLRQYSQNSY